MARLLQRPSLSSSLAHRNWFEGRTQRSSERRHFPRIGGAGWLSRVSSQHSCGNMCIKDKDTARQWTITDKPSTAEMHRIVRLFRLALLLTFYPLHYISCPFILTSCYRLCKLTSSTGGPIQGGPKHPIDNSTAASLSPRLLYVGAPGMPVSYS